MQYNKFITMKLFIVLTLSITPITLANSIHVIDERGNKIESARGLVRWKRFKGSAISGSIKWENNHLESGQLNFNVKKFKKEANALELFLQADGYGPEFLIFGFDQIPSEIKLEKCIKVILQRKDKTVAGEPVILPVKYSRELFYDFLKKNDYPIKLTKKDSATWNCELKKDEEYVIGWKCKKGWFNKRLFAYRSEVFRAENDGQIVPFSPGMPGSIEYDLSEVPEFINIKRYPITIRLEKVDSQGKPLQFGFRTIEQKNNDMVIIPNLAAGKYFFTAINSSGNSAIPFLSDKRIIEVKSGKKTKIRPQYPILDKSLESGDVTISGVVLSNDGQPLKDKEVTLWMQKFDENKTLVETDTFYEPAITNAKGVFIFTGVKPNQSVQLSCSGEIAVLEKESLARNAVITTSFVLGQKKKLIAVGEQFEFPVVELSNGNHKSLAVFKDNILVIDIWASWCLPCIASMPKINELAKKFNADTNEVKFITLSIDDDKNLWKKFLDEKKWPYLFHAWIDNTKNDFKLSFNSGIPYYIIVNNDGLIKAAGNNIDLEGEIRALQVIEK